ncbi:hypothetical protein [Wenzhouxiangella marina]|uniref:hypothetical protein n=1 Tax=Wenzhouxiangella marina TaxID=1579979 RepID=UPI0012E179D9|nr:hypothetical protein [Wenzhouxiangella marina]MBB6087889.1 hypothetical protein [Wenzhouxiangella marina]
MAQSRSLVLHDLAGGQPITCNLTDSSAVQLDADSGDLFVPLDDYDSCLDGGAALGLSPLIVSPDPVVAGSLIQVLWTTVGASSCSPDPSSTLAGWTAQSLGLEGPLLYTVPAATPAGEYSLAISCSDGDSTVTQSRLLEVEASAPVDPPGTPSFTVNGSTTVITIQPGAALTLAWASTNASSCEASGTLPGWSGVKTPEGVESVTTSPSLPNGPYTVRLRCLNASGSSPLVARGVTVSDAQPTACDGRALLGQGSLSNWTRKTTGLNTCVWSSAFVFPSEPIESANCRFFDTAWPQPWPAGGSAINLFVDGSGPQFIAMAFNSGNVPANVLGQLLVEPPSFGGASAGLKMWSISRCPGDFNQAEIEAEMGVGCIRRDSFSSAEPFQWGGAASIPTSDRCGLEPFTDYYLNIIWTTDPAGTPPADLTQNPACAQFGRCGMGLLQSGNYSP